jgi:hypothetical protein
MKNYADTKNERMEKNYVISQNNFRKPVPTLRQLWQPKHYIIPVRISTKWVDL